MSAGLNQGMGDCVQTEMLNGVDFLKKRNVFPLLVHEEEPQKDSNKFKNGYKNRNVLNGHVLTSSDEESSKNGLPLKNVRSDSTFQSSDEDMAKFKGRSCLIQYLPLKPIKRGVKFWVRSDAKTGYTYDLNIYSGPDESRDREATLGEDVVAKLAGTIRVDNGFKKARERDATSLIKTREIKESFEPPTLLGAILTQISFYILMLLGYLSQALFPPKIVKEKNREGYPSLFDRFSAFYNNYVYRRVRDCWDIPICSVPGSEVVLKDRVTNDNGWTFEFPGTKTKCLNLASYNYLGFAETSGPCADAAIASLYQYGVSTGNTRLLYGTCPLHNELETLTAEFLGVEDAITFGMGFATNALNIPTLISPGCLVISDEKNHASLILGIRLPGATVKVFKHNNVHHLEQILKEAIYYGQPNQPPNTFKPWKKILIVVEGVYSMEGTIVRLPEIIALKKKYKAYLYLDEAHSIGAMGKHGRGVVDYFGCDPKDIDILMGTFTKSFGSAGGYIAGSKELITFLRKESYASKYAWAMAPPLAAQIISVLKILMGKDGTNEGQKRLQSLARNTRYVRLRLEQMGLIIHGNDDSPVVPILVYLYSKIAAMVRTLRKEKIATVGVGYPATPLTQNRIRICMCAAHTKEQLDYAIAVIEKVADEIGLKYSRKPRNLEPIDYYKIKTYHDD